MKPRLTSAPLTQADIEIMDAVLFRMLRDNSFGWYCTVFAELVVADMRDADLMLLLEKVRKDTNWARPADHPKYAIAMTCIRGHHAAGMQFPNGEPL